MFHNTKITRFFFFYKLFSSIGFTLQIKKHFKDISVPADLKYIDPTYMVRACRANASDAILCTMLGQNAVS
jgi:6-phosphofructokinase 1